jgi:hypothetical protein
MLSLSSDKLFQYYFVLIMRVRACSAQCYIYEALAKVPRVPSAAANRRRDCCSAAFKHRLCEHCSSPLSHALCPVASRA